jgi:signal transduction histidine kinase
MTRAPLALIRRRPALIAAAVATTVLVAEAGVLPIAVADGAATSLPERLLGVLVAAALLLGALLALPRSPGVAWPTIAVAAELATLEVVTIVRSLEPVTSGGAWRDLAMIAGGSLVASALVAAGYAARRRETAPVAARLAVIGTTVGLAATAAGAAWAVLDAAGLIAPADGALTPLRVATRIALATTVLAIAVGAARDLAPAVQRAAHRLRNNPDLDANGRLWQYLRYLADELAPMRSTERRRVAEAERGRLAADLHALVLPDLRRAAARAASAGVPSDVELDLRRALEDVEQLMHQRQSVVLEQFGLVAALEWLAERTEERSPLRVELELDGNVSDGPGAVDPTVARAAFRIALLALDNVVRHAGASKATIRLSAPGSGLRLQVIDDGAPSPIVERTDGRGRADMWTEATASGGSVAFDLGAEARVDATWPSRGARNPTVSHSV